MVSEEYAVILKKLITITETKNLVLANITGYDVSYISKWVNGVKLPATKYIEQINEKLAKCFAEAVITSGRTDELSVLFAVPVTRETAEFEILQQLSAAYRFSMKHHGRHRQEASVPAKVITGNHDAFLFMNTVFKEKMRNAKEGSNLLILGDFCTLLDIDFWKFLEFPNETAPHITIHVGIDLEKLSRDTKYTEQLYIILGKYLNYEFKLYHSDVLKQGNTIIMENEFVIQYSLQSEHSIGICTYISDTALVQDIYNRFYVSFANQQAALAPVKTLGIEDIGFRTAIYSSDKYFFFLTNGVDFLLPTQAVSEFLAEIKASKQVTRQIGQLQIMWDEMMASGEVEFMLPMTSIIRYIETGYMFFTDKEFKMKAPYRKMHLQHALDIMEKNPKITVGVIQASMEMSEYQVMNLSFYSNYTAAFFKKNPQYIRESVCPFYVVANKKLVECFHTFFRQVKQMPMYHHYAYTDIRQKYEQYKGFVERTIDLYEDA